MVSVHAVHSFRDIGCAEARLAMLPRSRRQLLMLDMVIVVWFLLLLL